ncbi:hypothetical protein HDV00_004689 [Rhizophlyctis rosea]|nr:hypothetical protein HDV00_004689 [Rhizophlyctis rosea]
MAKLKSIAVSIYLDTIEIMNWGNGTTVSFCGFFGPINGQSATLTLPAVPVVTINEPWIYSTINATNLQPDTGNVVQWLCPDTMPPMEYPDLQGVMIQAWRDTNVSKPIPMDISSAGFTGTTWNIQAMWEPFTRTVNAYFWPHPGFICAHHNADYIEIGNFTQAGDNIVVAWIPEFWHDQSHAVAAYATYVKNTQVNGTDTIAFHLRIRPNPVWGSDYDWLNRAVINCTAGAPRWLCPDHILFKDEQMGWQKEGLDVLRSLNDLERAYFKRTGFLASIEIEPLLQKYTVYGQENYAIPFAVMLEPWLVNRTTIAALGLTMPPNGTNEDIWGASWWESWTINKANEYIDAMYNAGYNNLLPLPSEGGGETKMATFLGFPYGASVLDVNGRCGLDDSMVTALNNTIFRWRQKTNWTYGIETAQKSNVFVPKVPGVLPWRETYPDDNPNVITFADWLKRDPLDDPRLEPVFSFEDASLLPAPNNVQSQPGFAFDKGYGPDYARIYPPTGAGYMGARLFGIPRKSQNATRAFEVLMGAFARNRRHQVNCPSVTNNNRGGISGFLGATAIPEYLLTPKSFYDGMIDHTITIGTPAAQGMSFGQIAVLNPMQIAFNDILYKNMSIDKALARACVIINANTKPPCTAADLEPYLEDDIKQNSATLQFRWKAVRDCNENLPNSAAIPAPLVNAVSTSYVSTNSGVAKAMTGLASACGFLIIAIMLLFIHRRNSPAIRAASWTFSLMILLGGVLTLASVVMRVSKKPYVGWSQCFGTYWLFALGFGLVMGSLLVKTYRVDRIFRNKRMGFNLPDIQLISYVLFIELVEIGCLLILQFKLDDSSYNQTIQIPLTDYAVLQNACPKSAQIGPILLYIWNAFIILLAAIYALRTRSVQSAYNENIFTVAAIALISVISVVIVPVISIISSPTAVFMMVSLGTIIGTTASVLVYAIPKLMLAYNIVSLKVAGATVTTRNAAMTSSDDATSPRMTKGTNLSKSALTMETSPSKSSTGLPGRSAVALMQHGKDDA